MAETPQRTRTMIATRAARPRTAESYAPHTMRAPLRVLLVSETLLTGGAETFVLRIAGALRSSGVECSIYVLRGEAVNSALHKSIAADVPLIAPVLPFLRLLLAVDGFLYLCGSSFSLVRAVQTRWLRKFLRKAKPDVVHSHLLSSDLVAASACSATNIAWVTTMHGDYLAFQEAGRSRAARIPDFHKAVAKVDASVQHVVAITDPQLQQVQRVLRRASSEHRVSKIYNGYSAPRGRVRQHPTALKAIPENAFVIGMVARGQRLKGWASLVTAFTALNRPDTWLVLVGDGEFIQELRTRPPMDRLILAGNVTDPLNYIERFDVACLPTRYPTESLPTVVIEYLVSGKPVVATDVGEIARMIEAPGRGAAGALIPLGTEELMAKELTTVLSRLRDDRSLQAEFGDRARAAAVKFEMSACIAAYISVYHHAAKSERSE